jgi:putative membrane protein
MRWFYLAVIVLFVAAIVVFSAQNLRVVDVSFLGMSVHMRLPFLIAIIYLLGAVTGGSLLALLRRSFEGARQRPGASS